MTTRKTSQRQLASDYQAPEFKVAKLKLITLGGTAGEFDPGHESPGRPPQPDTEWGELEETGSDWY